MCIRDRVISLITETVITTDTTTTANSVLIVLVRTAIIAKVETGPTAVSYTHLDVYKRQEVNELKKQKADLKISEEDYTKKLSEIKSGKDTPCLLYTS